MSAPSVAGVWFTRTNAPFPDTGTAANVNNSTWFMLKEMLKGTSVSGSTGSFSRPASTLWTVEGSCDGVLGALDGVDRLTGTVPNSFDGTKWVHAASGTAHSWIVLKSPAALGPVWMCIDMNTITLTAGAIVFSRQAFVATPAPQTGSRPITNQGWMLGTTVDPIPSTNAGLIGDNTTGQVYRAHIIVDASGAFHYMTNRNSTGFFNFWMTCFNAVDGIPADTKFNTFTSFDNTTTGKGSPTWSTVSSSTNRCTGRTLTGANTMTVGGFVSWQFGPTSFSTSATVDLSGTVSGSFRALPPYIDTLNAGANSWRGRMPDTWIVGAVNPGDQFPVTGSQTHIVVGDLLIPFPLSASL